MGEISGDVTGQEPPAVVALVEKQADGITFTETQFVADAIFRNFESLWRSVSKDELWRNFGGGGLTNVARQIFVIRAARAKIFCEPHEFFLLPNGERRAGLRKEKIAELFHKPAGPAVARAVDHAKSVGGVRRDDGSAQGLA